MKEIVIEKIQDFLKEYQNSQDISTRWDVPIVGFASADEAKLISDWSHRHIAYIAGVGNFGLNNMLITDKGCCGRIGSFITSAKIAPDIRADVPACLYKYDGSCRKCVQRCVNEALFENSFNRFKCYDMLLENVKELSSIGYADVCGKCLVAVPCSHINPVMKKRQSKEQ